MSSHTSTPGDSTTAEKVRTALRAHPGATSAQIADTAGVGRSTAAKTLSSLASHGQVSRTPGIRAGGTRAPDQWHPTPAAIERSAAEPTDPPPSVGPVQPSQAPPAARKPKGKKAGSSGAAAKGGHRHDGKAKNRATTQDSQPERLKSGALRGQVEQFLADHPDEHYTPTALGHLLGRSSGAITNALDRLVADNYAVLVRPKPKTYRSASPE